MKKIKIVYNRVNKDNTSQFALAHLGEVFEINPNDKRHTDSDYYLGTTEGLSENEEFPPVNIFILKSETEEI